MKKLTNLKPRIRLTEQIKQMMGNDNEIRCEYIEKLINDFMNHEPHKRIYEIWDDPPKSLYPEFENDDQYIKNCQDLSLEYWIEDFKSFCSPKCLERYLRANSWNLDEAKKSLLCTLDWRFSYKPHLIDPSSVEEESLTGKNYINGYDKEGKAIIYLRNHLENSSNYARMARFLVFTIEAAIKKMEKQMPHQEKIVFICDFKNLSATNSVPLPVSKYFLHLFSKHYPERLGTFYGMSAPWYFTFFFSLISPFMADVTKSKLKLLKPGHPELFRSIDKDVLEKEFLGESDYQYEHTSYWKSICRI
jgi:hypothetical protein